MKALIIYNNFTAAARANAALQQSVENADCAVEWDIIPWRVDLLKFPPTSGAALADAADAHLILFVGRCAESLPFWLQDWLERWASGRLVKDVALAVMNEENAAAFTTSAASEWSHFATRHGLNIIFDRPKATTSGSSRNRLAFAKNCRLKHNPAMAAIRPPALDARTREAYQGWGIND